MSNNHTTIHISTSSILKIVAIILGVWFLYTVRGIVAILLLGIILALALRPVVDFLERKKIPRVLGAALIYIICLSLVVLFIYSVVPPIIDQIKELGSDAPQYYGNLKLKLEKWGISRDDSFIINNIQNVVASITNQIGNILNNLLRSFSNILSKLFSLLIILVLSFYLTVAKKNPREFLISKFSLLSPKRRFHLNDLGERTERRTSKWIKAQVFLCLIIGVMTYIGLKILGLPYALSLAVLAGSLELIPYVGPILSAIPAVILALLISPILALWTLVVYIVIQQLENNLLVPKIMQKTIGLNPVVTIIVLLVGGTLGGILGIILAIPVTLAISEFIKTWPNFSKK